MWMLLIGIFIGVWIGVFVVALCVIASDRHLSKGSLLGPYRRQSSGGYSNKDN